MPGYTELSRRNRTGILQRVRPGSNRTGGYTGSPRDETEESMEKVSLAEMIKTKPSKPKHQVVDVSALRSRVMAA